LLVLLSAFMVASVLIPLLARIAGVRAFVVAALVPAAAFAYTVAQAPAVLPDGEVVERLEWIPSLGIALDMRMDALSWLLALVVTGVGALVLLYCARYFRSSEEGLGRFAGLLLAFAGVMYGLVLASRSGRRRASSPTSSSATTRARRRAAAPRCRRSS
jgi:multicomponent Na+:H+ antiporter subunit A